MTTLPMELVMHVASFLDSQDLVRCNYVSDNMNLISRDYSLWKKFFIDVRTASTPEGRLCHTGVVHDDKMYIFGGHITQPSSEYFHSVKQDLQSYDFAKREWQTLNEEGPRRTEHTAVVEGNCMYVFGGYSGVGYENSVMVYDFSNNTWTKMDASGDAPAPRSAHTAVMVGKSMFVFGGWNGTTCMNDMYELRVDTQTWAKVQVTGEVPSTRCSHGATVFEDGASSVMTIFGGYSIEKSTDNHNKGYLNDLYQFDLVTRSWKHVRTGGTAPSPRSRFRMVSHMDSIYLFAGWNSNTHFSSLYKYSLPTRQWSEIPTNFDEEGIGQFSLIVYNDVMYVFSGYSPKSGSRKNLFAYPFLGYPVGYPSAQPAGYPYPSGYALPQSQSQAN